MSFDRYRLDPRPSGAAIVFLKRLTPHFIHITITQNVMSRRKVVRTGGWGMVGRSFMKIYYVKTQ